MATPIGHALAGCAIYGFCAAPNEGDRRYLMMLGILMAISPDFDVIPGILMGKPALFHQGITHSVGFGLMASVIVASVYSMRRRAFFSVFTLCLVSYVSHLVIDIFGPDGRLPYGIPLLWPMSGEHFISPVQLFLGVHHSGFTSASTLNWMEGLLDMHNLGAIGLEIALIAPLILLGKQYRRRHLNRRYGS